MNTRVVGFTLTTVFYFAATYWLTPNVFYFLGVILGLPIVTVLLITLLELFTKP